MTRPFRSTGLALAAVLALTAALATTSVAVAQSAAAKAAVDSGKAHDLVGEQADGYLALVSGGDSALSSAVDEINAGRAQAYQGIAAKTGVSPAAAGQATARELFARLHSGQYYRGADGAWRRK